MFNSARTFEASFNSHNATLEPKLEGFSSLSADQMNRIKAGFDTEEDDREPGNEEPETDPETEPVGGDIGSDDLSA